MIHRSVVYERRDLSSCTFCNSLGVVSAMQGRCERDRASRSAATADAGGGYARSSMLTLSYGVACPARLPIAVADGGSRHRAQACSAGTKRASAIRDRTSEADRIGLLLLPIQWQCLRADQRPWRPRRARMAEWLRARRRLDLHTRARKGAQSTPRAPRAAHRAPRVAARVSVAACDRPPSLRAVQPDPAHLARWTSGRLLVRHRARSAHGPPHREGPPEPTMI